LGTKKCTRRARHLVALVAALAGGGGVLVAWTAEEFGNRRYLWNTWFARKRWPEKRTYRPRERKKKTPFLLGH